MKQYVKKILTLFFAIILSLQIISPILATTVLSSAETTIKTEQTTEKITETTTESAAETTTEPETEAFVFDESKMGDVDSDGKVTSSDARILLRVAVKLETLPDDIRIYGDFDRNGEITSDDARTALRIAVKLDSVQCILHGHKTKSLTIAPTCTEKGYTLLKCQRCEYQNETNIKKPLKHTLVKKTTEATCTKDGIFTSVCSVCSYVAQEKVAEKATGHSFGVWELSGKTKTRICKTCKYKETAKNVKTIYLTFDDGPGAYTEKLLKYLKQYDVKATFFVTNQNPKYKYVLKKIVEDGHAIGVHSNTHQWSIYSSRKSYLNDFNTMHKIILDETGVDTKIFRFPGGTNNTVSRKYSRGIMKDLASYMTNEGYIYFDWNVDCYDTSGYNSSKIAQATINQIKNRHSSVVLMHDIRNSTVEAVKTIIEYGLKNGYEFAVIDESTPRVQFKPAN